MRIVAHPHPRGTHGYSNSDASNHPNLASYLYSIYAIAAAADAAASTAAAAASI